MIGIGPSGADFNGIIPGNKQAIMKKALNITTSLGLVFFLFIFYLRRQTNYKHLIIDAMSNWQSDIQAEFETAAQARARGNEGQARVCARRAAGIAIREYLARRGIRPPSLSAYDLLNQVKQETALPADLKLIADHLTVRVTEEFKLPVDVDLVAEARRFCEELLKKRP
jgi:hypothetical protein